MNTREEYVSPTLEELGTFERLTQASGCPDALDAQFPAGTPFGDLTCGPDGGLS
ncbi:lasso RiPP family leader peptide-containing protein [Aurantiacibacter poecillastricola]|uniref:lasso RiPP family leader peptide-containing protein n=1 Tax=Aurantiacibacter poecillastricola TaxID=3064385 RepID=UPI00273F6FC7|nr:lasso RiPP family leader peptide-containing protein [Aurantiacibacter sp. 219JJ12-13]MDP5263231.1 lasso RiPP family leader peptide-containing protein [Aurantiacibacter sp. 219JJ12-13]